MNLFQNMTFEKYQQIKKIVGEKQSFVLNPIEFGVNTDRSDSSLLRQMADVLEQAQKVAAILGISIDDMNMKYDWNQSDHEVAFHQFNLNPSISVGSYVYLKDELCLIESEEDNDIFKLKTMNGEERIAAESALRKTHWGEIFLVRDKVDAEKIYAY